MRTHLSSNLSIKVVASLLAPLLWLAGCASAPPQPLLVRIGHVGPLSGSIAHLGLDNERGARLAIDELNTRVLKIGGRPVRFELLAEDDAADPRQGVAAAQRLVAAQVHAVVGHLNSGVSIPAAKIYSDAGVPQVSPASSNPRLTQQGYKTVFRVIANDDLVSHTLGRYVANTMGLRSVAMVDDRTAYGQITARAFGRSAQQAGARIVAHEFVTDRSSQFAGVVDAILARQPDVIFFGGMDAVAGPLIRDLRARGSTVPVVGADGMCSGDLPALAGAAGGSSSAPLGPVVCAGGGDFDPTRRPSLAAFHAAFQAKYQAKVQVYAAYAYDAVQVIAAAMQAADSTEPAKFLPALARTKNHPGATGPISFDERGDVVDGAVTLYTYKGGRREVLNVVR